MVLLLSGFAVGRKSLSLYRLQIFICKMMRLVEGKKSEINKEINKTRGSFLLPKFYL